MGHRIATAALATLALGLVGAVPVDVCVEPSFEAAVAVLRLDERAPTLTLRPVRPDACAAEGRYRMRFAQRGPQVALVLSTPGGERLERVVPWLDRAEDAIIALARRGRLGSLAVLAEGLVVEDHAARRAPRVSPPIAAEPGLVPAPPEGEGAPADATAPGASTPGPEPSGAEGDGEVAARAQAGTATIREVVAARRDAPPRRAPLRAEQTRAEQTRAEQTRAEQTRAEQTRAAPVRTPPMRTAPVRDTLTVPDPRPPPPPEPSPFSPARDGSPEPTLPPDRTLARAEPPAPSAAGARGADPAPDAAPARFGLGLGAAMRSPRVWGLDVRLRLAWRGAILAVGYTPPIEWSLDERPLRTDAAWLAAGWAPRLLDGALAIDGQLALVVERLTVRRLELPDAVTRALWDVGLGAALCASAPMHDGWRLGARVGARWLPTANDVIIPDGPRTAFNTWQVHVGLLVDWSP